MMNNSDRTLVILTPGFPENEADSTCLPAQQIFVSALKNNFPLVQIIVLSFQYPFNNKPYLWNGIRVVPFNGRNRGKLLRMRIWVSVLLKLNKIKKENNIIGLFSFWATECALVGTYFSKLSGIKHCSWISGQDAKKENGFINFIRPKSGELVAMSRFLAKEFYKNHSILPAHIIPNGIDPNQFNTGIYTRDIEISAVGSLIGLKQYDILIDIISKIKEHIPAISAVLCGKGPEENNLRAQIDNLKLDKNVSLTGEKSHPEVLQLLQRSKVFLHPSSYEGFSSVCMEALYAGAHVISFCDPGVGDVKHWHIVTSKEEMFTKALEILRSPDAGHEPVLTYSMNDSAEAVMKLFVD